MSTPKGDARVIRAGHVFGCVALAIACNSRASKAQLDAADSTVPPPAVQLDPPSKATSNTHRNTLGRDDIPAAPRRLAVSLLALPVSAYHVSLVADDAGFTLLSEDAVYRLVPGRAPAKTPIAAGSAATLGRSGVVFWSDAAIRETELPSGRAKKLVQLEVRPQSLLSSGAELAWLERGEAGTHALRALASEKPRLAYQSEGSIEVATMLSDWVFFVERAKDGSWRIGGVKAARGTPVFSEPRRGRTPAMLVAHRDLHYYDGTTREVRRLSPDFQREDVLARDFVCSPLAVWDNVYCAQVEGISEIREGHAPERLLEGTPGGPVAAIAANSRYVAWVADAGADKLEVKALALSANR